MKVAVAGKGGSGKTTVAGTLARLLAQAGHRVRAIDADPNPNLAVNLGVDPRAAEEITSVPLSLVHHAETAEGKYSVGYNSDQSTAAPEAVLTCPIWHWGVFYSATVQAVLDGTWVTGSYWGGWKDGLVDLSPIAEFVPDLTLLGLRLTYLRNAQPARATR